MKLEKGDELAVVLTGEAPFILLATEKRVMILDYREIIELAGPGKGVKLMAVDPSGIRTAAGLEKQARLRINTRDGKQKDYSLKDLLSSRRGGKGRMIRGGIQDVEVPNS
jgi:DNA gyrase/topoisomerase IV subunit A